MLKKILVNGLILSCPLFPWVCVGIGFDSPAQALPGQSTEEVTTWMNAHPTLRPGNGEKLYVQKSDTAAQRFTFQASVLPPGRVEFTKNRSRIRYERLAMYDAINGMSFQRLQESLRVIYGYDIYQDFNQAEVAYDYPSQGEVNSARFAKTPIKEALQGQLRVGDRYAYWIEIAKPQNGKAFTGQMTVLLKTDVNKLLKELQTR